MKPYITALVSLRFYVTSPLVQKRLRTTVLEQCRYSASTGRVLVCVDAHQKRVNHGCKIICECQQRAEIFSRAQK